MQNPSLGRLAGIVLALTVVAFGISGIFRNADHGAGLVLGDIGWYGFLLGLIALVAIGVVALVRGTRRGAA